jgi:hypothetical protein
MRGLRLGQQNESGALSGKLEAGSLTASGRHRSRSEHNQPPVLSRHQRRPDVLQPKAIGFALSATDSFRCSQAYCPCRGAGPNRASLAFIVLNPESFTCSEFSCDAGTWFSIF